MRLLEGGNVFKDQEGHALTQRINQTDVKPTVSWLEQMTGLDLMDNMLGSTGKKPTSGDLDLAVNANEVSKEDLESHLKSWAQSQRLKPEEYVKKSGNSVHFKAPIIGNPEKGYVQVDFMFIKDIPWSKFFLSAPANSEFKGRDRNILVNSIAKAMGYKLNQNSGIVDRATEKLLTNDVDKAAELLLGRGATSRDMESVETILARLANDPKRDEKLADAREHFKREGIPFVESVKVDTEVNFLARLRDRIVNQGMYALIEHEEPRRVISEGARIEHLEDLIFERGSRGASEALSIVKNMAENTAQTTTIKWDGKPAILWGRKDNGDFVLTDKSGFTAKGYDGLATSPGQLADIMSGRGGDRSELIAVYNRLFPLLEAATPANFRGYAQGDLLYSSTPPVVAGAYVFKPNFIEYRIPVDSTIGRQIGDSDAGVAMHTYYEHPGAEAQPIEGVRFKRVPGLLLVDPKTRDLQNVKPDASLVKQISHLIKKHAADIDTLFSPGELRSAQISDLPALCKRYINSRIDTDFTDLLPGFAEWLHRNVTERKFNNIIEYVKSPRSNENALAAAFTIFLLLNDLKTDVLHQLDKQQPGHEGWVAATPSGRAKFVDRFGFSAGNRALNNPERK